MNTPNKSKPETEQAPIFDPFPKPQTIPSGWDMSEFDSPHGQPSVSAPSPDAGH
jgi:hypothetical protein